ncbi:MAG: indolepyruvate ferredoxin oxidoreductase family protein [Nitratireductor sp.]|nr:indolepyruvate ferredoxin oxidoreductase family protein [Nitratireductor sp.]
MNLETRYRATEGTVYMSGLQAMLRILLDQARADKARGLNTGGLVSGYPGSPLGGVDSEMIRHRHIFEAEQVQHQLGLNEELAATAIYGTQLVNEVPDAKVDGVFGMWFGKSPGVDRAADAFHHANFHGVARTGGVLAVVGDDPHARSTILPSDSNVILASFYMPVLAPGDIQDVIDFGRHGYEMSRACGLWVGLKLVSDIADSSGTAEVGPDRVQPVIPEITYDGQPFSPELSLNEAGGAPMIEREREVYYGRLEIARQYARLNGLNRITAAPKKARLGIVAGGKTYFDVREALTSLGIGEKELDQRGIRLLKMGLLYPFDEETAHEFADGLEEILIVEDKRPLLESFFKEALYGKPDAPRIAGKKDADGRELLTAAGELSSDLIAKALRRWLKLDVETPQTAPLPTEPLSATRSPYFCSGCPHNRSLRVPEGSVVGAGIGCHIMTLWMEPVMGKVRGYTQMGGEGAQWVGLQKFTGTKHFFQNLGDGTYSHSGSLSVRFAIAAKANITFKLLYNSAVAMTGGQDVFGGKKVPDIIREMAAEGVKKIIVTTDEPERYRNIRLDPIASVRHRDDLIAAESELAAIEGVTVLINDQQCAAEKRRMRKRGRMPTPATRVMINERICEGCGDCGAKSNCLSVEPVPTEFGRKTRINQTSCNQDYSCLLGDCPSFLTIENPGKNSGQNSGSRKAALQTDPPVDLLPPIPSVPEDDFSVFMAGIGGTGVVTVNQILGMAAALAGRSVRAIDQIGSSQKAGPVTSHLKIRRQERARGTRIMSGKADLFLAFDLLSAAEATNLAVASPDRTLMIANSDAVPTGSTVTDVSSRYPSTIQLEQRVGARMRPGGHVVEALTLSRLVFGNDVAANLILVGAAYQAGALPLPIEAIEQAIRLNGSSVEANLCAIRWGRCAVQAPEVVEKLLAGRIEEPEVTIPAAHERQIADLDISGALARTIRIRTAELIAFQDERMATNYLDFLATVRATERRKLADGETLTEAVARNLYKLTAYKDEYEVARLMVDMIDRSRQTGEFESGQKFRWLVHPTFLRAIGVRKKVALGPWFLPVARLLARMKGLRNTRLDLLGRTKVRRAERALIGSYRGMIVEVLDRLTPENSNVVVELARLPDMVRGYEDIKLGNIARMEAERTRLLSRLSEKAPAREAGAASQAMPAS